MRSLLVPSGPVARSLLQHWQLALEFRFARHANCFRMMANRRFA
jgi:hypothetical protein